MPGLHLPRLHSMPSLKVRQPTPTLTITQAEYAALTTFAKDVAEFYPARSLVDGECFWCKLDPPHHLESCIFLRAETLAKQRAKIPSRG